MWLAMRVWKICYQMDVPREDFYEWLGRFCILIVYGNMCQGAYSNAKGTKTYMDVGGGVLFRSCGLVFVLQGGDEVCFRVGCCWSAVEKEMSDWPDWSHPQYLKIIGSAHCCSVKATIEKELIRQLKICCKLRQICHNWKLFAVAYRWWWCSPWCWRLRSGCREKEIGGLLHIFQIVVVGASDCRLVSDDRQWYVDPGSRSCWTSADWIKTIFDYVSCPGSLGFNLVPHAGRYVQTSKLCFSVPQRTTDIAFVSRALMKAWWSLQPVGVVVDIVCTDSC